MNMYFLSTSFLVVPDVEVGNLLNYWIWISLLYSKKPVPDFDVCEDWLLWKFLEDALEHPPPP